MVPDGAVSAVWSNSARPRPAATPATVRQRVYALMGGGRDGTVMSLAGFTE
jgi:hypothetical protein